MVTTHHDSLPASTTITPSEFGSTPSAVLNAQSVLYSVINLHGRSYEWFPRTCYCPTRLDSPYTQSSERFADRNGSSSTQLSSGFNLARHRWSGFRSSTIDSKRAHFVLTVNCGLVGFPSATEITLNLANDQDSWGIFRNARIDAAHIFAFTPIQPVPIWFPFFSHPAKDSFQLSLTLLVNYRSRYLD